MYNFYYIIFYYLISSDLKVGESYDAISWISSYKQQVWKSLILPKCVGISLIVRKVCFFLPVNLPELQIIF